MEAICIRSNHSYNKHVGFFLTIAQAPELLPELTRSRLCKLKFIPTATDYFAEVTPQEGQQTGLLIPGEED